MSILTGHNLAKAFGDNDIFEGVTVSVPHGARIALVGPNGAGKTTLLRILAGLDRADGGQVAKSKGVRLGFLPQEAELSLDGGRSLWEEMLTAIAGLLKQEAELHHKAEEMAQSPGEEALLADYGALQERFEAAGGYEYPTRIRQVLGGLGFEESEFNRPAAQLSGGQKTRALLAKLLLESPDLLILDEPTNHLDIGAIEWLERWLKTFEGALILVSHDRYFMDNTVNQVWELIFGRLEAYRGNYSHYVLQREERHANLLSEFNRQQEFIAKTEDYIARNIAGQNTRQAQGRRKRLERFVRDEAVARPREQRMMRLNLQARRRSGDKVLETKQLVIGYHDDRVPLFAVPDIKLARGECAALMGPNGAGKSTFLKTILGQLAPLGGESQLGAGVEIGYFAQAHEGLNPSRTVLEEILAVKEMPISEGRNYLAKFLFSGDDIEKPVSALSGGERGRVALAKLALSGANLLLLDEPTNHLDIPSQEILEAVLAEFEGTILLVSHDRYLIRDLATQVWTLDGSAGRSNGQTELIVFPRPYDEFITWREGRTQEDQHAAPEKALAPPAQQDTRPTAAVMSAYQRRQRLAQVEETIHRLEIDLVNLSGGLSAASTTGDLKEVSRLGEAYSQTESQLDSLLQEWETLVASH